MQHQHLTVLRSYTNNRPITLPQPDRVTHLSQTSSLPVTQPERERRPRPGTRSKTSEYRRSNSKTALYQHCCELTSTRPRLGQSWRQTVVSSGCRLSGPPLNHHAVAGVTNTGLQSKTQRQYTADPVHDAITCHNPVTTDSFLSALSLPLI